MNCTRTTYNISILGLSFLILAYSTVLQFSIPSIVLCFGDDGHIAFEQSNDDFQCVDVGDREEHSGHNHENLAHEEDNCDDIPLNKLLSTFYLKKDGKIKPAKLIVTETKIEFINIEFGSLLKIKNFSAIIHSSMKSLKTSILLI